MDALGGFGGAGGFWGWNGFDQRRKKKNTSGDRGKQRNSGSSDSVNVSKDAGYRFPLKQAVTAGALTFTGDTIAQISGRWNKKRAALKQSASDKLDEEEWWNILAEHDWVRALRMSSYGLFLYGPGSYAWYQFLDYSLPKPTATNLVLKVLLNQVVLGPIVIGVIFAWNNLWLGKLSELGNKYQKDALPTLLYGFRFWIPVSILNFSVVPLQARVAFMSMGSVFWNFYLSSAMSK
uniref:Protein SYM1 n=1 Tax=Noccaea caerulescens TaxID=107243 RepID=A0A1J3EMG0_NOCCA